MNSVVFPPLISEDSDSESGSDIYEGESGSGCSEDDDWPPGYEDRPKLSDYDKNGLFKRSSKFYDPKYRDDETRGHYGLTIVNPLEHTLLPGNARDLEPSIKKSKKEAHKTDKTPAKTPAKPVLKKVMDVKVPEDKSHPMIKWYFEQVLEKYIEYDLNLIAKKCQEFPLNRRSDREVAAAVVYDRAMVNVSHCANIAYVCKEMRAGEKKGMSMFNQILVSLCKKRFMNIKGQISDVENETDGKFTNLSDDDLMHYLQDGDAIEKFEKWTALETIYICHMTFFAELYKARQIDVKLMFQHIQRVYDGPTNRHLDAISITGLLVFFKLVGTDVDIDVTSSTDPEVKEMFNECFAVVLSLFQDESYSPATHGKLQELMKLKEDHFMSGKTKKPDPKPQPKISPGNEKENEVPVSKNTVGAAKKLNTNASPFISKVDKPQKTQPAKSLSTEAAPFVPKTEPTTPQSDKPQPRTMSSPTVQLKNAQVDLGAIVAEIKSFLAKANSHIIDENFNLAIESYRGAAKLFKFIRNTTDNYMDLTYICLYTLLSEQNGSDIDEMSVIYSKLSHLNPRTKPFLDFINLINLSKDSSTDFKETLVCFERLNKRLETESWTEMYYPISKRVLEQSKQDVMKKWLLKFVTTVSHAYKDTFNKCVHEKCKNPGLFIIDHEDFDSQDSFDVLECSERCMQYYHHSCYKSLGKWNIDEQCFTPDCTGSIIRLYENRQIKRESKVVHETKKREKPAPPPPPSPRSKRKGNKKRLDSSTTKLEEPTPPSPSPPPPTPSPPPPPVDDPTTSSPDLPPYTGDDVVDMFGTMLIYLEEAPKTHLTNLIMQFSEPYPWLKVDIMTDILNLGIKSLVLAQNGQLERKPGSDQEKEEWKEHDETLLICHFKYSPIAELKMKISDGNKEKKSEEVKKTPRQKHPSCEQKKRKDVSESNYSAGNSKETGNAKLNPVASAYVPNASPSPTAAEFTPRSATRSLVATPPSEGGYVPFQTTPALNPYQTSPNVGAPIAPNSHIGAPLVSSPHIGAPLAPNPHIGAPLVSSPHIGYPFQVQQPIGSNPLASMGLPLPNGVNRAMPYTERKSLLDKIGSLEQMMRENETKYKTEVDHYKNQLVDQMDTYNKLRSKAKQYKQDAKNAQESTDEFTQLQEKCDNLKKQIDEERKNWLSERSGKSVESKKIIVSLKIEIEEANKLKKELEKNNLTLSRERDELAEKLDSLERASYSRDQALMKQKKEVIDLTNSYKATQQQNVMERFTAAQFRLRIAYANCEAQIRDRSSLPNFEKYYVKNWQKCQEMIRRKIDDNNIRYQDYTNSLHTSRDIGVTFEEEPPCPPVETEVPVFPLQRYDDILLGRAAPPIPTQSAMQSPDTGEELNVLADLMMDPANFTLPPETPQSGIPFHLPTSTPAFPLPASSHFQFPGMELPPQPTKPPSSSGSSGSRPPSIPLSLASLMNPATATPSPPLLNLANLPDQNIEIVDSVPTSGVTTRVPGGFEARVPPSTETRVPGGPGTRAPGSATTRAPGTGTPDLIPSLAALMKQSSSRPPSAEGSHRIPNSDPAALIPNISLPIPGPSDPSMAIPNISLPFDIGVNQIEPMAPPPPPPAASRGVSVGRGRSRPSRIGQSTVPQPPGSVSQPHGFVSQPPGSVQHVPQPKRAGPDKGVALKKAIKDTFPFLSEKETMKYLKRVKEDTDAQGIKVAKNKVLELVSNLVSLDYPSAPPDSTSVVPISTCVICHEALNLQRVSELGCGHSFHKACVDAWFATQNHTCPTCRSHEPPMDMFPPLGR